MKKIEKTPIIPDTKIGTLLDHYPELETILMELSPKFEKLKNPVLRKTVAKVANLRQIAKVGNLSLPELINTLRRAAGIAELTLNENTPNSTPLKKQSYSGEIAETLDIREQINAGEQPISIVMEKLTSLPSGKTLELIAPFEPAPLIDLAKAKGFAVHLQKEAETGSVHCHFTKPE